MKRIFTFFAIVGLSASLVAQDDATKELKPTNPDWKMKALFGLNITQSSFTNWSAGGRNNISGLGFFNGSINYLKGKIKWDNRANLALGGVKYLNEGLQKTDDVIDLQSSFGYGLKKPWYFTILSGFKTQSLDGFNITDTDTIRTSTFMAPAYGNLSFGIEYAPNPNFNVFVSPLSSKFTFVRNQALADLGAYGVEGARLNPNTLVLDPGKQFRYELGAYARVLYNKELAKNIQLKSRLELFSNYQHNPQNIDVNAEAIITFKVNSWFNASLQMNLLYDDDINIEDSKGKVGPRTQFKQVIGLGLSYTLANYREEKK